MAAVLGAHEGAAVSFDTQHEDMLHDAQLDYYSRKLATASSDRTIKIFDVLGDQYNLAATLSGHAGPVWQVSWAHPKFGVLLASCSFDGKVVIHREAPAGVWAPIHEQTSQGAHQASVNSIAWAPHEYGLVLGCASADGTVTILKHQADDSWAVEVLEDPSRLGCNAVNFAPVLAEHANAPGGPLPPLKLATGGCDKNVRIWEQSPDGSWGTPLTLSGHADWVRDVAFAPNDEKTLVSCSEDKTVLVWTQTGSEWASSPLCAGGFESPVWRVSWSVTGNLLAVSSGDAKVTLWKQSLEGDWESVADVPDTN